VQISDRRGVAHQPLLVSENHSDCPFVWYQNIHSAAVWFCHKARVWRTDGQTDRVTRQNCDS